MNTVDLLLGALFSIMMAVLGTLARVGHELSNGEDVPWAKLLWLVPMALTLGIIGHAAGEVIGQMQGLQNPYISPALSGGLGLLGPVFFTKVAESLLEYFKKGKTDGKP